MDDFEQNPENFSEILSDPRRLREYAREAMLHGELMAAADSLPGIFRSPPPNRTLAAGRLMAGLWPIAAAAFAGAALVWMFLPRGEKTVAVLHHSEGCQWAGSELPTAEGSRLAPGKISLTGGMATLLFDSGASVMIEAPATLEILSKNRCRLLDGSLVAEVPERARGFTVDAPELEVVDLGTRFGLTANQFGKSHLMVFEGEVKARKAGEKKAKSLHTGHSLVTGSKTDSPSFGEVIQAHSPALPVRKNWSEFEAFKDSFVRFGAKHGNEGQSPLVMVKETSLAPNNRRRGIVSFVLRSAPVEKIREAELFLDVESSGLGFSTLVPDSSFAVYGITDDSLDDWEENEIVWNTFPAATDDSILPGVTAKVGTFEILRGAQASTSIRMNTPELARLLREDGNRIITLLIVRETGEFEDQGLVHAFAAREHLTAKAPTLYLKLEDAN